MKKKIILIFLLVITLLSLTAFGCSSCNETEEPEEKVTIQISSENLMLKIGDREQLKVTNSKNADYVVAWSSDNAQVATVDDKGNVVAQSIGVANIVAKIEGFEQLTCKVAVSFDDELPILVFENEQKNYVIGKTEKILPFTPYVFYNNAKFYDIACEYASSNENVLAFSDSLGGLNLKDTGKVTVTIKATWRNVTFEVSPLLQKSVEIEVKDSVFFFINGRQYSQISLYATNSFEGEIYQNSMEFKPTIELNGTKHQNVTVEYNDQLLTYDDAEDTLTAHIAGKEKVVLKYTDGGKTYTSSVDVNIIRPESTYKTKINYFSSYTGTYKDESDGFADKTLTAMLFGQNDVEGLKVYQDGQELTVDNGKILGVKENYKDKYDTVLRFESNKYAYNVNATVASLFVQNKDDLKYFELKTTATDNPETRGIDETRYTYVDGYCEMIDNVDADGLVLEHTALAGHDFTDSNGVTKSVNFDGLHWSYNQQNDTYGNVGGKFGFIGTFNGKGYTIFNLDTSNETNYKGGLFGYLLGGAKIENVGFSNLKISESTGLANANFNPKYVKLNPPLGDVDALGVRTSNTVIDNVFISLSEDTVNPRGVLLYTSRDYLSGWYDMSNIIVDGTRVESSSKDAIFLINDATSLYASNTTRNNIYVVSKFNYLYEGNCYWFVNSGTLPSALCSVGAENIASGAELNKHGAQIFASGIKTYKSFDQMALDGNAYDTFSDSWRITSYPTFKSSQEVFALVDGEQTLDNTVYLSSDQTAKRITLENFKLQSITVEQIINSDGLIDVQGSDVKLVERSQTTKESSLDIKYTYKGSSKTLTLKVVIVPDNIVIADTFEISQTSGDVSALNKSTEPVLTLTQQFEGAQAKNVTLVDGKATDLVVKVKADKSGVEPSKITLTTKTFKYEFNNVYVYSHIISQASDFEVFARSSSKSADDGYYVMANNVDMDGATVTHSGITYDGDNHQNVFMGTFDGRGYAVINFKPQQYGMFGKLYANAESQATVKNVAFVDVQSEPKKDFTILAYHMNAADGAKVKVENVYVDITSTSTLSDYRPTSNYIGLVYCNSQTNYNTFSFKNILITIENEQYTQWVQESSGTLFSRDEHVVSGNISQADRSSRFDNVVTVTKQNPVTCRMAGTGDKLPTQFGLHQDGSKMFFMYSINDLNSTDNKHLLTIDNEHYQTIAENPSAGSYILDNVYRYNAMADFTNKTQIDKFADTGCWVVKNNVLYWKSVTTLAPSGSEHNFDIDFLK